MTDYSFNEFATIMINDKTLINDSNKIYNNKELFYGYIKYLMTKKYDNNFGICYFNSFNFSK